MNNIKKIAIIYLPTLYRTAETLIVKLRLNERNNSLNRLEETRRSKIK